MTWVNDDRIYILGWTVPLTLIYSLFAFQTLFKLIYRFTQRYFLYEKLQTRFQKSWDTVQIVNKKGMQ